MKDRLQAFLSRPRILWWVYGVIAVLAAIQRMAIGFDQNGYSRYENYRIFKYSWHYFITGANPYTGHPETWDLYKYSPVFSVVMAPFYAVPDWIGLPVWNLLNALPLLAVLLALPGISLQKRCFAAWLVLPELVICLQNTQSNGLMAALMIGTYIALTRNNALAAAGYIMAGVFIKLFGIFAAFVALFYRRQWVTLALAGIGWGLFLALFPGIFTGWDHLKQLYEWWWWLLRDDHAASLGLSVAGWLNTWFGLEPEKSMITIVGLCIQTAAVAADIVRKRTPLYTLASVLIWVVIFNHKAESPTFIIAFCGVAIWYFAQDKPSRAAGWAVGLAFFLASVTPTDLFPPVWYRQFIQPFTFKAVPFIMIWVWMMIKAFRNEQRTDLEVS
jgi:Glycosyltransferase family 87